MPVARLWKSPWMTLTLCLSGSSGSSVRPNFIPAPEPSEIQWSSFTPLPMKMAAKRLGNGAGEVVSAKAGRDSSHGRAMVTPAPYRSLRRETPCDFSVRFDIGFTFLRRATLVAKLAAGDDGFD